MNHKYYRLNIIYNYLINYISLFDIDYEKEKDIFLNDDFLEILLYILENNKQFDYFTEEMYKRIGKLIIYIRRNMESDLLEDIVNAYNEIEEFSYNFYQVEFLYKYNIINSDLNDKVYIWNKKDMEQLVKDDYHMLLILENKKVYDKYMKSFVGNIDYLLFINKLINVFPRVLLDKEYKKRLLKIIECNKELSSDEKFSILNNTLYTRITNINDKNIDRIFTIRDFESIYYETVFEKMIVLNEPYNLNYSNELMLEILYEFIEYYSFKKSFTKDMKDRIINIMYNFKLNIKNLDLNKYNEHLVIVNSMEESKYGFIEDYLNRKGIYFHNKIYKKPYLIDEYLELINLDLTFLESLLCDNDYDEKYLKNFIYNDDYFLTIKRYMNQCPLLFSNKNVYDKVVKTLNCIMKEYKDGRLNSREYYIKNKKVLNKLKKMNSK